MGEAIEMRITSIALLFYAIAMSAAGSGVSAQIPTGDGKQTLMPNGVPIEVFTHRPAQYSGAGLLFVIHGVDRNPDAYRDHAKVIADRLNMIVVAPFFDSQRFPSDFFQLAGIVRSNFLRPRETWTSALLLEMVNIIRLAEGNTSQPYYFIGHSAGAQMLSRFAAFSPNEAARIVISNPSSLVFPDNAIPFPFGFGGATASLGTQSHIKDYLARPITIFVGMNDRGSANRDDSPGAAAQGTTRYDRSINFFNAGKRLAEKNGWPFSWRLVEVPGVGHNAKAMFASRLSSDALK
jgi:poly(3-hydroxybutyrate) depolymerase